MRTLFSFLFLFLFMFFGFCCAPAVINYHPSSNQIGIETRYVDGNKLATSKLPNSSVSVVSVKKKEYGGGVNKVKFLIVDLVVTNSSSMETNFLPEDVQVLGFSSENKMKALKTYTHDEFMAKIKRIQKVANAAYAMSNSMSNINAGKTTSTTNTNSNSTVSGRANTFGSMSTSTGIYASGQSTTNIYGNVNTVENSTTTTIDHDAKRRADKETRQELRKIRQMQSSNNQEASNLLLKANTLSPGQVVSG
ncbi:MAG: hypothetical protein VXA26_11265, partial [Candidatus Neomarinimicrobiota bacterium]